MNAKDLALPKLNATEDLVDIYTTAAMIGIPFATVEKMMTSSVFSWINRIGKNNIFDNSTDKFKVKNMVKFALLEKNSFYDSSLIARIKNDYDRVREKLGLDSIPDLNDNDLINSRFIDNIIAAFESKNGILDLYSDNIRMSDEEADELNQELLDMASLDGVDDNYTAPAVWTKNDAYYAYRIFKLFKERQVYATNENLEILKNINNLIDYSEEMTALGRQASINQGIKTNIYDLSNFENVINQLINKRISQMDKNIRPTEKFDFSRFLSDDTYRAVWLNVPGMMHCFNILETLNNSPHFFNMSKIVPYVHSLLDSAWAFREIINVSSNLGDYLSKNDYQELARYTSDMMIYSFLENSRIELDLNKIAELTGATIETYETSTTTNRQDKKLRLNSLGIASFKHIMESIIIPYLKGNPNYTNNSFVRDLCMRVNRNNNDVYTLPIQMMDIDSDEGSLSRYRNYLRDFNTLAKDSFAGENLGGLFFLYNLIVNKNSFGDQSLTRIFEDLVDSKNSPKIIKEYYDYISNLDSGDFNVELTEEGAKYRLNKYSRGTKITSEINPIELPEDFTFDLLEAGISDTKIVHDGTSNLYTWVSIGNTDVSEVLNTFKNKLNSKGVNLVEIIDDDFVKEQNLPKERGFIKDGKIYLNESVFKDSATALGVAIHEVAHLIIAGIKSKAIEDPSRQTYYSLLQRIKNDPEYEMIASRYEDRVGSDLAEEVLCNKIQKLLTNRINNNSDVELAIVSNRLIVSGIREFLTDARDDITLEELITSSSLEQLVEQFAYSMFNFVSDIKQDFINGSQKLAYLKNALFESKDENNNLKEECL